MVEQILARASSSFDYLLKISINALKRKMLLKLKGLQLKKSDIKHSSPTTIVYAHRLIKLPGLFSGALDYHSKSSAHAGRKNVAL
jgi:hypothetical protein